MNVKRHFWIILMVIGINGCSDPKLGLHRSSLQQWERRDFPSLGISMECPVDKKRFDIGDSAVFQRNAKCKDLVFSLHPIYPSRISEPEYLIEFRLAILNDKNYELFKNGKHRENATYFKDKKFFNEIGDYIVMHPNGVLPLLCLRKDYKNEKTGEIVLAAATYIDQFEENLPHREADLNAIKRILNSIQFIEGKKSDVGKIQHNKASGK